MSLQEFEQITSGLVLAISIVGAILSVVYINFFYRIDKLHKSPGDIYLGMSVAELIYMMHCASDAIIVLEGKTKEFQTNHKALCYVNLVGFTLAVLLIYSYTIQLYLHMIIRLIYTLQAKKINKWQGHLLTWLVSIIYSLISIVAYNESYCGVSISKSAPFTFIILLLSFYAMAITARIYIKDEFTQNTNEKLQKQGTAFLQYMTKLFIAQSIIMTSFLTFAMVGYILDENAIKNCKPKEFSTLIQYLTFFAQISATIFPVVIPIIRFTDPFVYKHVKKYYFSRPSLETSDISLIEQSFSSSIAAKKQPKISLDDLSQSLIEQNMQSVNGENVDLKKYHSLSSEKHRAVTMKSSVRQKRQTELKQEDPFIHQLTSQLRSDIIKRIIALILLQEKDKYQHLQSVQYFKKIRRNLANQDYDEQIVYTVNQVYLNAHFPNQFQPQNRTFKMISYAPIIFNILVKEDIEQLEILNCLDLLSNEDQIQQCAQTTGGKSGEFFFFNHNNRVLLKTISLIELQTLIDMIENYFWHCTNNPNTTIAKILGIYTFEGFEVGRISLILMKNIGKIDKGAYYRQYDLKGSSYDREVIKSHKGSGESNFPGEIVISSTQVLKDLDFINLEKSLNITPQHSSSILEQLEIDTLFLKQQGFMDYSLCIIIVDWLGFYKSELIDEIQDEDVIFKLIHQKVQKLQHCYQNIVQPGQYYHIGIIDYLQIYNLQKITEKYAKKIIKLDSHLDTSSQNPYEYRKRFLAFMKRIL